VLSTPENGCMGDATAVNRVFELAVAAALAALLLLAALVVPPTPTQPVQPSAASGQAAAEADVAALSDR
jgi:hypothetical protein